MTQPDTSIDSLFDAHDAEKSNGKAWLVTFTDLVSLLLTFFVMLFAMSTVQLDRWQPIVEGLTRSETPTEQQVVTPPRTEYNISTNFRRRAMALEYLEAVLAQKQREDPVLGQSTMELAEDRLIISLPGDLLFEPGSALLSEAADEALFTLGTVLRNLENPVAVAGHTARGTPGGDRYASNWELSLGRAVSVANALRANGFPEAITAYGYGDAHYHLLPDSLSETEKDRLARRVDILILSSSGG
ncbi:MAG: OmpA/MotB family protein [Magnetospiraceae bacterium]